RWKRAIPSSAPAGRTFQSDECNAIRLSVQVHWLRNVSCTAAVRAVVRTHSSPSLVGEILSEKLGICAANVSALRNTNKNGSRGPRQQRTLSKEAPQSPSSAAERSSRKCGGQY